MQLQQGLKHKKHKNKKTFKIKKMKSFWKNIKVKIKIKI